MNTECTKWCEAVHLSPLSQQLATAFSSEPRNQEPKNQEPWNQEPGNQEPKNLSRIFLWKVDLVSLDELRPWISLWSLFCLNEIGGKMRIRNHRMQNKNFGLTHATSTKNGTPTEMWKSKVMKKRKGEKWPVVCKENANLQLENNEENNECTFGRDGKWPHCPS